MVLSGALTGIGCWAYTFLDKLQAISFFGKYGLPYFVSTVVSGIVIAGVLMWFLYIGIAKTGALDQFASGREIREK